MRAIAAHPWFLVSAVTTAYPEQERELRRQLREAALDHDSFVTPLRICELATCRATCCHDGVILETEEREIIDGVIRSRAERLAAYGWREPEWIATEGRRVRSVTKPATEDELAAGFPAHFPRTRCVFLDAGHRCVLQRLAADEGRHPWFWKPISCWMHPLVLRSRGGRPMLTLPAGGDDPSAAPGYPGFSSHTPCGIPCPDAPPARDTLAPELRLLGEISGRDLLAELR